MGGASVISIIGSLNTDLVTTTPRVPDGGETLTATSFSTGFGGKGANQAVAAARLSRPRPSASAPPLSDVTIKMIGAVGSDTFGPPLVASMKADGIDMSGLHVLPDQTTGVAVIIVEEGSGENRIMLNPGANHFLQPSDFSSISDLGSPLPSLIILQLEIRRETVEAVISTAKKAGVPVLLNPAPAVVLGDELLDGLDHLIVNETEAAILSGREADEFEDEGFQWGSVTDDFLAKGVRNVVVTLGWKGAFYAQGLGQGEFVEAERGINVVDTTAAGDTFVGAYAVAVVRGMKVKETGKWDMKAAVTWACKAAGRTVEKRGAQSAIPWANEVDRS